MTKNKLIEELQKLEGDPVIICRDGFGWANIEKVESDECTGIIKLEENYSPFSDE